MTTPPTLDHFEAGLLDELRTHVATRAPQAAPAPPARSHGRRWAAGLAVAAATATAFVLASPGGPAVSPASAAYAVAEQANGDVVVTIHRLEDSEGLEAALREHGIDADVSFDPESGGDTFTFRAPDGARAEVGKPASRRGGTNEEPGNDQPGTSIPDEIDPAACGMGEGEPATLTHEGDDWVLLIPAESPLQDRPVQITTGADGQLGAFYSGAGPGEYCGVVSVG